MTNEEKIKNILKNRNLNQLKKIIKGLFKDNRDGSFTALMIALNALEKRIPETDFVKFCNSL